MDYPCGKSVDCSFSRFGSIMRTNRRMQTHRQTQVNALLPRLLSAWVKKWSVPFCVFVMVWDMHVQCVKQVSLNKDIYISGAGKNDSHYRRWHWYVYVLQLQEFLQQHDSKLPLPAVTGEDTIFEYVVGDKGTWEHWQSRVRCYLNSYLSRLSEPDLASDSLC